MKPRLAAALLALAVFAPAASAAPRTPTKLLVSARSDSAVLVTWHNLSLIHI